MKRRALKQGTLYQVLGFMEEQGTLDFGLLRELIYDSGKYLNEFEYEMLANCIHNLHSSSHVKQCFNYDDECRYSCPKLPLSLTTISSVAEIDSWCLWTRYKMTYKQFKIEFKWNEFDIFMNQYCPVISKSKLATNSNCRLLTDARSGYYVSNYSSKPTQEEDEAEYDKVLRYTQKRMYEKRFEIEFSESLSRLLGASFVHSSSNVISAWLAKFLIRNESRFLVSHNTVSIPVYDIETELFGQPSKNRFLKHHGNDQFLDSRAQQYIFRPEELKDLSCKEFYLQYNDVCKSLRNESELFLYKDTHYPGTDYMGAKPSLEKNRISKFPHSFLVDAISFQGDIMTVQDINGSMEEYACRVMIMYSSYRTLEDLQEDGSYVKKFRCWTQSSQFMPEIKQSLTNIQNIKNTNKLS